MLLCTLTDIPIYPRTPSFERHCFFSVGGYELNKEDHILALQEDEPIITEALRSHLVNRMTCKWHTWNGFSLEVFAVELGLILRDFDI